MSNTITWRAKNVIIISRRYSGLWSTGSRVSQRIKAMAMTHLHSFCCGSVHCERVTPLSLSAASVVSQTTKQYPKQSSNINISDPADLLTLGNISFAGSSPSLKKGSHREPHLGTGLTDKATHYWTEITSHGEMQGVLKGRSDFQETRMEFQTAITDELQSCLHSRIILKSPTVRYQ